MNSADNNFGFIEFEDKKKDKANQQAIQKKK